MLTLAALACKRPMEKTKRRKKQKILPCSEIGSFQQMDDCKRKKGPLKPGLKKNPPATNSRNVRLFFPQAASLSAAPAPAVPTADVRRNRRLSEPFIGPGDASAARRRWGRKEGLPSHFPAKLGRCRSPSKKFNFLLVKKEM